MKKSIIVGLLMMFLSKAVIGQDTSVANDGERKVDTGYLQDGGTTEMALDRKKVDNDNEDGGSWLVIITSIVVVSGVAVALIRKKSKEK
ncbi:MAG: hypothetical protein N4A37_13195 [Prolixibacteraceae bacterium]|jgi:hypothetical protein|nr:hypothetical protein [Prolixibacteraceae bacterium]